MESEFSSTWCYVCFFSFSFSFHLTIGLVNTFIFSSTSSSSSYSRCSCSIGNIFRFCVLLCTHEHEKINERGERRKNGKLHCSWLLVSVESKFSFSSLHSLFVEISIRSLSSIHWWFHFKHILWLAHRSKASWSVIN